MEVDHGKTMMKLNPFNSLRFVQGHHHYKTW